jgi:hypothetical protein
MKCITKHVWVIEMLCEGWWEPTVGCALTRRAAYIRKRYHWEEYNPFDKFRVKKYIRRDK